MDGLNANVAFIYSILGSFVVYFVTFRGSRMEFFLQNPKVNFRLLLFDLIVFIFMSGFVTVFVTHPTSFKEAFLSGGTWGGIIAGSIAGTELRIKKFVEMNQRRGSDVAE